MIRSRDVPILLMGLGLLLPLNPLYAFSDGAATANQYGVEPVGEEEDDVLAALQRAHNVHFCPGVRTCVTEERIADEGGLDVETAVLDTQRGYDVVLIDGRFYEPTVERTDDGWRLDHEALSTEEALAAAAIPSEDAGSATRGAIRWGVVGSDDPVPALEERRIVEHDGTYYQQTSLSRSSTGVPNERALLVRVVGFAVGLGLLGAGYRRYRRFLAGERNADAHHP